MSKNRVGQICTGLGERANVPECRPHRFRHTFAYRFVRNGGSAFALQRLLGHEQISTVMIYVEMQDEDVQKEHESFSPVDRLRNLPRVR
jgi:integrase/recombinase XerD